MIDLETRFTNLIKYASITRAHDDSKAFPVAQIRSMGKVSDAFEIYPYGLCAVAPIGSLAVSLNVQAQEENKAFIATLVEKRFNGLKEGEVAIGNFLTGAVVKFLASGDIEVYSPSNVNVKADGDISASSGSNISADAAGNVTVTAGGNISATASVLATIAAPTINLTGNVVVSGTLSAAGGAISAGPSGVALTGTLTSNGKNISDTHIHSGVTAGANNSGPVV